MKTRSGKARLGARIVFDALHEGELALAEVRDPMRVIMRIGKAVLRGTATGRDQRVMCRTAVRVAGKLEGVEQRMCGLLTGLET